MAKLIYEVFEEVAKASTRKEKAEVLRKHNSLALRDVLKGAFDDTIEFILPPGSPPFAEDKGPAGHNPSTLNQLSKRFRYFAKGGPGERLQTPRRERMYIELLESIHPKDAEIVVWMKDKKLEGKYKGLTKKLVQEAFPKLIVS